MDIIEPHSQGINADGVDPALRAHVYGLVSALGGPSPDDPNTYVLGDDVLGCLRDIKRWLKGYDEKLDRLDVARCLSEANLVLDLMEILSHSPSAGTSAFNHPNKVGLACLELLVPLTWPLNKTELSMTVNHHRHLAVLRRSQAYYKKSILTHRSERILKACCVNALPSMALPPRERTPRDEGVIRLVLYLIRNILQIEELEVENDSVWEDISKSSTIELFDKQGVFSLILSVISGIPELFEQQDVIVIEILFYLLLGVNMQQIVTSTPGSGGIPIDPLARILRSEKALPGLKAQSRHTRFGTTVVLKKDDGQKKVIMGHGALLDEGIGLQRLDATKKWRKPQHPGKKKRTVFGGLVHLSLSAQDRLCVFLSQILISGFNSLFQSVRKAIERDSERVLGNAHITQLFFVGGALIELGRTLRRNEVVLMNSRTLQFREFSTLLQPETFIVLFRHIREGLESKLLGYVQSGCRYFTQALLLVSDMINSQDHDDASLAENIFSRLFYEETLQDLMITTLRSGHKQTIEYLDTVTETIHVYLRCLERYSKSNAGMLVKSKRLPKSRPSDIQSLSGSDSDTEAPGRAQRSERLFDFQRCESKFLSQSSIEPFLDFLTHYKELKPAQIKRCIGFLHRVFVKRGVTVGLFHLKAIRLLHVLARDTKGSSGCAEVAGFVQYFCKSLIRKLNEYPVLFVEMLFQKPPKIGYFIQHGEDRGHREKEPRLPPAIEIEKSLDKEKRIAVAVSLVARDHTGRKQFDWVEVVLNRAVVERGKEEIRPLSANLDENPVAVNDIAKPHSIVIKFEDPGHALVHFSSNKLQLLMRVLDFELEGTRSEEFCYLLPDTISSQMLQENIEGFLNYRRSPISRFEDGRDLEACIVMKQRKPGAKHTEPDIESDTNSTGEEFEFPDNIKETRSRVAKRSGMPSRRKGPVDENEVHRRRQERKLKEKERRQGIKSGLYIESSDDDSDFERDREFFENERILREAMSKATINAEGSGQVDMPTVHKKRSMLEDAARESKRLRTASSSGGSGSEGEGSDSEGASSSGGWQNDANTTQVPVT